MVDPGTLCQELLKIERGESAKLKKISKSVAMITRLNMGAIQNLTMKGLYRVVVVDGILTDCDQKC